MQCMACVAIVLLLTWETSCSYMCRVIRAGYGRDSSSENFPAPKRERQGADGFRLHDGSFPKNAKTSAFVDIWTSVSLMCVITSPGSSPPSKCASPPSVSFATIWPPCAVFGLTANRMPSDFPPDLFSVISVTWATGGTDDGVVGVVAVS